MSKPKKSVRKPVVVAVSGYFNPLHVGHVEMMKRAKKLGDKLVAIVNNDYQVKLKGSVAFMPQADRLKIVAALRDVDEVFLSIDRDKSVRRSLAKLKPNIFANGGDRHSLGDVPEYPVCQRLKIKMVDGLGRKIRASSAIIAQAAARKARLAKRLARRAR
jgi:cytidyltransferase-like protein